MSLPRPRHRRGPEGLHDGADSIVSALHHQRHVASGGSQGLPGDPP
ncbi:hypothetical protein L083_6778 [Actinoplanes sp. N902-109]|nr:hypothetical protein L083_6778 [Actinoplanes sp. N902-109]